MDEGEAATLRTLLGDDAADAPPVAMVMTMVGREHSSRPVVAADVREHRLSFLVDRTADWVSDIAREQALLHVTVTDSRRGVFVALNGCAHVEPKDDERAVLHFDVERGEYWRMSGLGSDAGITSSETMKGAIHGQVLGSSEGSGEAGGG